MAHEVKVIKDATSDITGIQMFDFTPPLIGVAESNEQKAAFSEFNKTVKNIKKVRGERTKKK